MSMCVCLDEAKASSFASYIYITNLLKTGFKLPKREVTEMGMFLEKTQQLGFCQTDAPRETFLLEHGQPALVNDDPQRG